MEENTNIIKAVIEVLGSVTLRVDQVESIGKINACIMKLEETLKGANNGDTENQQGENV